MHEGKRGIKLENKMQHYIIESIKFLATPAEQQLSYLPDFVNKPVEIAQMLSDWLIMYEYNEIYKEKPLFTEIEYAHIKSLDEMIINLEISEYTIQSVKSSIKWEEIRSKARFVLEFLNIVYTFPVTNL